MVANATARGPGGERLGHLTSRGIPGAVAGALVGEREDAAAAEECVTWATTMRSARPCSPVSATGTKTTSASRSTRTPCRVTSSGSPGPTPTPYSTGPVVAVMLQPPVRVPGSGYPPSAGAGRTRGSGRARSLRACRQPACTRPALPTAGAHRVRWNSWARTRIPPDMNGIAVAEGEPFGHVGRGGQHPAHRQPVQTLREVEQTRAFGDDRRSPGGEGGDLGRAARRSPTTARRAPPGTRRRSPALGFLPAVARHAADRRRRPRHRLPRATRRSRDSRR